MQKPQIDDLGFCPSFNCYSSDSSASTAAARISTQLQQEDEFEFSLVIGDEVLSPEDIYSDGRIVFPLFNRDLLIQNDVEHETEVKLVEEVIDCSNTLAKLFINEREGSASSSESESETDESEGAAPVAFCVWRYKPDGGSSPLSKCKKSRSTGSGSKRWRIRDLLRRSNSEGKEPVMLLSNNNNKKVEVEVQKRKLSSGEVSTVAGKLKASTPSMHEVLYVQQRAEREVVKRRSYLPYRQGLVGLFSNGSGKGMGKRLLF